MGGNMDVDRLEGLGAVSAENLRLEIENTKRRIAQLEAIVDDPEYLALPTIDAHGQVPMILIDGDFKLLEATKTMAELLGYECDEINFGADVRFFFPKAGQKTLEAAMQQLRQSEGVQPWESELLVKDGSRRSVITGLSRGAPGNSEWIVFFFDLNDRKKLQAELVIREANLRTLADAIPQLIWVCDAAGQVIYANGGFYEFSGLVPGQPVDWSELLHPLDRANFKGGQGFSVGELYADFQREVRLRDARISKETFRWYLLKVVPFFNPGSASMSWLVIATDVDDQRRVTDALMASEEQLRIIADAMPQIVWTADASGTIDFWNHRWLEYTGLTPQQSLQGGWRLLIHSEDLPEYDQKWQQAIKSGETFEARFRLKRALGLNKGRTQSGRPISREMRRDYLWHLCRSLPLKDSQSNVLRWFGTWTEIDEHKAQF